MVVVAVAVAVAVAFLKEKQEKPDHTSAWDDHMVTCWQVLKFPN